MRALWTERSVNFEGNWHRVSDAGLNPLPIQRPIPIWLGGMAEPVLKRIARIGDGWFPQMQPDDSAGEILETLKSYIRTNSATKWSLTWRISTITQAKTLSSTI